LSIFMFAWEGGGWKRLVHILVSSYFLDQTKGQFAIQLSSPQSSSTCLSDIKRSAIAYMYIWLMVFDLQCINNSMQKTLMNASYCSISWISSNEEYLQSRTAVFVEPLLQLMHFLLNLTEYNPLQKRHITLNKTNIEIFLRLVETIKSFYNFTLNTT